MAEPLLIARHGEIECVLLPALAKCEGAGALAGAGRSITMLRVRELAKWHARPSGCAAASAAGAAGGEAPSAAAKAAVGASV